MNQIIKELTNGKLGYRFILLIGLIGAIAVQTGCSKSDDQGGPPRGGAGGRGGGAAVRVEAVIVETEELKTSVRGLGILLPSKEIEIQAEMAGRVQTVFFKDGQSVRAGESLVKIEDANLRAAVSKAYSRLVLARNTAHRKRQLFDTGAISAQEWDFALADLRIAEADSADAAANLLKTLIWAPFDGKLGISRISIGKRLSVGEPIVRIVQKFPLKVDFSVADKYAPILRTGMEVNLSRGGESYKAVIEALESSLDGSTRTLQARAIIAGKPEELVPGAPLEFSLELPTRESLTVPPEAILSDALGSVAYLYKGGKAQLTRIELGTRFVDRVEIISGIAVGDTVLCVGASPVRNGGNVEISRMKNETPR
ncbi:MAG: efflux RND transporter periplasmic adaptor subunit [Fibromonadaceae bacterium]|jgi:membrane fusion protein (multidrug efflux system)|nr:efflux RND transporter periplasmic adaptor subunit [Fibromonadaceae bacterium]